MFKRFFVLTLCLVVSLTGSTILVGCGQKGPLYLPSQKNEVAEVEAEKTNVEQNKPAKETKTESSTY